MPTRDPRYGNTEVKTVPLWPQNTTTDGAIARTFASWQIDHLHGLGARSCAVLDRFAIRLKQAEAQAPALRAGTTAKSQEQATARGSYIE